LKYKLKAKIEMKKIMLVFAMLAFCIGFAAAQNQADIKFDKTEHNFGSFSQAKGSVSTVFTFTNVGTAPLVIHQAIASCGCTVPEYSKEAVLPGKTGTIQVTYDAHDKYGHFKKSVTIRTNAKTETVRLFIEGEVLVDVK
jgi:hypothetical protein